MFISLGRAQLDTEDVTDHGTFISSQVPAGAGGGRVGEQLASRRGLRTQACGARVCQTFVLRVVYVPWGRSGAAEDTGVRTPESHQAPWFSSVSSIRQGRVRLVRKPRLCVKDIETWSLSLGVGVSVTLAGRSVTHLGP